QIKSLDPLTQESTGSHQKAVFFPMRDYPLDKSIIEGFRKNAYENHPDPRSTDVYKAVSRGEDSAELTWWAAYSDSGVCSVFDLVKKPRVVFYHDIQKAVVNFDALIKRRHTDVL